MGEAQLRCVVVVSFCGPMGVFNQGDFVTLPEGQARIWAGYGWLRFVDDGSGVVLDKPGAAGVREGAKRARVAPKPGADAEK